jgi:hypothetical protein
MKTNKKAAYLVITPRALTQRINRALRKDGQQLRRYRGSRSWTNLGDYYVVDLMGNYITATHVSPEQFGRELGVLKKWERMEEI